MRRPGRWIVLVAVLLAGAVFLWPRLTFRPGDLGPLSADRRRAPERIVPESVRIRVAVLNATSVRGLARQTTFHLRDLGFDVVGAGNHTEQLDSSVVLVHTGRADWAELAATALGGARIEARPDTSRYLDLTILLGASWRPPPESFHP
jgi:hypothetical protein